VLIALASLAPWPHPTLPSDTASATANEVIDVRYVIANEDLRLLG